LLLFWLPVIGTKVAGVVGEKRGLGIGSATMAAILPAILVGGLLIAFTAMMIGVVLALGLVDPLLLGALIASIFE